MSGTLRVGAAQARPVWLDRSATTAKVVSLIEQASREGLDVLAFPETFLCGYPFWICRTNGAAFDDPLQKQAYAQYVEAAVEIPGPEIALMASAAADLDVFVFLGATERGVAHARASTYCTQVRIDPRRGVVGVHRKLVPTHDERMVWARGDGHGLRTHGVGELRLGGLSCWENWMPLARHALYADGEDVHIAGWPGWSGLTPEITGMIAREGRVYSVAVSGLLSLDDIPSGFPLLAAIRENFDSLPFNGGSCIAGPDGAWLVPPVVDVETIISAEVAVDTVRRERLMFDAAGHYSRPDVFQVSVDRRRHVPASFVDEPASGGDD